MSRPRLDGSPSLVSWEVTSVTRAAVGAGEALEATALPPAVLARGQALEMKRALTKLLKEARYARQSRRWCGDFSHRPPPLVPLG